MINIFYFVYNFNAGAAHGISSILFVLLSFNDFISNYPGAENDVKLSVDYLLSLQMPNGNFPCAIDELPYKLTNTDRELVHWCHGAPGKLRDCLLLW